MAGYYKMDITAMQDISGRTVSHSKGVAQMICGVSDSRGFCRKGRREPTREVVFYRQSLEARNAREMQNEKCKSSEIMQKEVIEWTSGKILRY